MRRSLPLVACVIVALTAAACTPPGAQRQDLREGAAVGVRPTEGAVRPATVHNVNAPVQRVRSSATGSEPTDPAVVADIRKALCLSADGGLDETAHKRLGIYLDSIKQRHSERFLAREMVLLNRLIRKNQTADCSLFG